MWVWGSSHGAALLSSSEEGSALYPLQGQPCPCGDRDSDLLVLSAPLGSFQEKPANGSLTALLVGLFQLVPHSQRPLLVQNGPFFCLQFAPSLYIPKMPFL